MKLKLITTSVVLALSFTANIDAQNEADPFRKGGTAKPKSSQPSSVVGGDREELDDTYTLLYEMFSLPMKEAGELVRSGKKDSEIYTYLTKKSKQEWLAVIRTKSGAKSSSQSINELIYPTKYIAPTLSPTLGVQDAAADKKETGKKKTPQLEKLPQTPSSKNLSDLVVPALPSSFETRNTGIMIEVEIFVDNDRGTCDMRIAPECVTFTGMRTWGQGVSKTVMPDFETQRLSTAVTCFLRKPVLLGTMNRSPFSKLGLPDRVWFAMVTVKPVTP